MGAIFEDDDSRPLSLDEVVELHAGSPRTLADCRHGTPTEQGRRPACLTFPANHQAAAWFGRLSQRSITTAELRDFFAWRRTPRNRAAYETLEADRERTSGRFKVLPDAGGNTVLDSNAGEPASFAKMTITGLDQQDADDIARLLNRRSHGGGAAGS